MKSPDIIAAIEPVIKTFESLDIPYYISGSLASSAYGIARATLDIVLVAELKLSDAHSLVQRLQADYYINENMIKNAVHNKSSFNVIHLESMIKVDIFVLKDMPYDRKAFMRKKLETIDEEGTRQFYIASPEDIILNKLEWYSKGGAVSEQQWRDVLGVLKVQNELLNIAYLRQWAAKMELSSMLEEAFKEAGIKHHDS